jgi:FtsP/CotA-like multicopper oxidase with cupredoxin domain
MFEVVAANPANPDASITDTTALRPHRKILESEVTARRTFEFERKNGHWAINGGFYDKAIANACPTLGSTEEWTLTNGSGGWWHPIHIHLENHQTVRNLRTGKEPLYHNSFNQDVHRCSGPIAPSWSACASAPSKGPSPSTAIPTSTRIWR